MSIYRILIISTIRKCSDKKSEPPTGIEPATLGGCLSNLFGQNNPNFKQDCNKPFNASSLKVWAALCVLNFIKSSFSTLLNVTRCI